LGSLIDGYHTKLATLGLFDGTWSLQDMTDLYDTFEPTYMQKELEGEINLGHLVFGENLFLELGGRRSDVNDPLTSLYRQLGFLDSPTLLRDDVYMPLFLPKDLMTKTHRETFTYRGKKQIWSLTSSYPDNMVHGLPIKVKRSRDNRVVRIIGDAGNSMLFEHIVLHTSRFSVGPLEYCGNGTVINKPGGHGIIVAICKQDPMLSAYATEIETRRKFRKGTSLPKKANYTDAQREKLNSEIMKAKRHLILSGSRKSSAVDGDEVGNAPKRRRLSADQKVAAVGAESTLSHSRRGTRRDLINEKAVP